MSIAKIPSADSPQAKVQMRAVLGFAAVLLLAGCGGGRVGASRPSDPVAPTSVPTTTPQSDLLTPTFTIVLPSGRTGSSSGRTPRYISPSTLSVKIVLNNPPQGLVNSFAVTNVNGRGVACSSGCTVSGPPSPPGTDSFTVTTYDAVNARGNAISTATKSFSIVAGSPNTGLTIVLHGISSRSR